LNVVVNFSEEDVAPRALYALGVSYEEATRYDSALAYYQRVLKEYPYSSYAIALRPRLADASTPGLPHAPPLQRLNSATTTTDTTATPDQAQLPAPRVLRPGRQNPGMTPGMQPPVTPPTPPMPPGFVPPPAPPNLPHPPPRPIIPDTTH
jgi:hypothetical protein